jgi:hypothetical protein
MDDGDCRGSRRVNASSDGCCTTRRQTIVIAQDPDPLAVEMSDPKQNIGHKANIGFVLGCSNRAATVLGDTDISKAVPAGIHLDVHTLMITKLALNLIEP